MTKAQIRQLMYMTLTSLFKIVLFESEPKRSYHKMPTIMIEASAPNMIVTDIPATVEGLYSNTSLKKSLSDILKDLKVLEPE